MGEKNESWSGELLLLVAVLASSGAGCGSDEGAAESKDARSARKAEVMERVRAVQEDSRKAAATVLAATREEVELPSRRRLEGFLPAGLPGFEHTDLSSDLELPTGRAIATGRYQTSAFDWESGIEIEITFNGKPTFNPQEQLYKAGLGQRDELAGFPAIFSEEEASAGRSRCELFVRIAPELWVNVSGPGPAAKMEEAAKEVDLARLAEELADRTLFEDAPGDVLERTILSGDELAALLPENIGGLERRGGGGFERFDEDPLYSQANGQYGSGNLTVVDYGDPEVARTIELDAAGLQGFSLFAGNDLDAVEREALEIADGRGSSALLREEPPRNSVLALHLARGRYVITYIGRFVPPTEPLGDALPAEMRREIERASAEMGAGVFESIEDQRDAMLEAIESLDLEPNKN